MAGNGPMKKIVISAALLAASVAWFYIFFVDGTYGTPVEAIEKARNLPEPIILVSEKEKGEGEVVFYLRYINRQNPKPVISVDFVQRTLMGWKWISGGGHMLMEADDAMSPQEKFDVEWSEQWIPEADGMPFSMLFGAAANPEIAAVAISDAKTGYAEMAEMLNAGPSLKIWYWFADHPQEKEITLQALAADGHVLGARQWQYKPYRTHSIIREDGRR